MSSIARPVARSVSRSVLAGQGVDLGYLIRSMFAGGEQGFFYDPNDLTTMFLDATGTIPVTGVGQPVGLVLDKSKGLRLGANQMTYPNSQALPAVTYMPDGVHTWTLNTQNPISGVQDSRLVVSEASSFSQRPSVAFTLNTPLVAGKVYKFSFKYKVNSGSPRIFSIYKGDGTISVPTDKGTLAGSGTFEIYVKWYAGDQTRPYMYFSNASVFDIQMNEFSIQEVYGNHAYQDNSASRPILRQNATTGVYYLEFDGSDDFLQTNNINFTSTDKITVFAGGRKLSDAAAGMITELSTIANTNNGSFFLIAPNNSNGNNIGVQARGTVTQAVTAALVAPANFVSTARINIGGDSLNLRLNGTQVASNVGDQGTGNYGNYPLYIGRRGGTSLPFNGHIYSLIGVGRLTTANETAAIEKELAKRIGVTLSV